MQQVRLAELLAALSLATDLGMGQPMEFGLGVAALAVETGRAAGCSQGDLADAYYLALVKHIGCATDALEFAAFNGGDDIALRQHALLWPSSSPVEVLTQIVRHTGAGRPPAERVRLVGGMLAGGRDRPRRVVAAHCEAGGRLAERLGLSDGVRRALAQEQERWDGRGLPEGLSGEQLSIAHRLVVVAHDALALDHAGAPALDVLRSRAGAAYDPDVVGAFVPAWEAHRAQDTDPWDRALAAEPGLPVRVDEEHLDAVALALADFADLRSPYLMGHSTRVAELADAAAARLRWPEPERTAVRRAALLHDLGRMAVPFGVWDKHGPLTSAEWERVRLHAYYTERVLARSPALAPLALMAGGHHEDLDGGGYHRGVGGASVSRGARLLRAADSFDAMVSERPHRPARTPDAAARELEAGVRAGRLDAESVAAVIAAAGAPVRLRPTRPAGLTERETEVLRLLVRGLTNKQIAAQLSLSPKTVGHHVAHIYDKAGVTSRAAVALFALETGIA